MMLFFIPSFLVAEGQFFRSSFSYFCCWWTINLSFTSLVFSSPPIFPFSIFIALWPSALLLPRMVPPSNPTALFLVFRPLLFSPFFFFFFFFFHPLRSPF